MDAKLYIILITASFLYAVPEKPCNRMKIGDHWYNREILLSNVGRPYNLNVNKFHNTLFFSHSLADSYSDVDFQLACININIGDFQTIAGIRGGCSTAVDNENDEVYLGGSDGIYTYNMQTKLADVYKEKGKNIWSLFHRKNLFYISYPDQKLYLEIDGKFAPVKEFENFEVDHFHIKSNNEIYFANKTGFYKYYNTKMVFEVISELMTVRQIAEDSDEVLYVCTNLGIFDYGKNGLKHVIDKKNIYGLAFDRDNNLIFSDDKSIIRLLYSVEGCTNSSVYW